MAPQLKALNILPENPDSITSTYMVANSSQLPVSTIPRDLVLSSALKACVWCTYIHGGTHIHIIEKVKFLKVVGHHNPNSLEASRGSCLFLF